MEVAATLFTVKEKECFRRFLSKEFNMSELLSLVETITNRKITVQNKNEAIRAIIAHSQNALELLRRRKVKREYIFRFLLSEKVAVSLTSDKAALMRQFFWHCGTEAPAFDEAEEVAREPRRNVPPAASSVSYTFVQQHIHVSGSTAQVPSITQELAQQFTTWFYRQLNSSAQGSMPPSEWGPQHFWEGSRLRLIVTSSERRTEVLEGAELVANRLKSFVSDEGLMFNPNISPSGTSGSDDPHGLVVVRVCGTIHRHDTCLGVFEQQFGLIRDPLKQNTWKIKFTDMNLKKCAVERMPTLTGPPDRLAIQS
ncbi:uncharacterized protein C3orf38 homolog [Asterias rubens]|uniref:uncharacterized protein C3orf38 homolog n=1 Tax=Asterias rubens TaxID=7604 RepID=UPI0014554E9F|nr:uncharacterized protein C3orf38 homolog [Asterias rubens]